MGAGIVTEKVVLPDLDTFVKVTQEYERLKNANLSVDEMHMLMAKRVSVRKVGSIQVAGLSHTSEAFTESKSSKDNEVRGSSSAGQQELVPQQNKKSKVPPPPQQNSLFGATVLLIDDSKVASRVASKVLQKLNFHVLVADSAQEGFETLKANVKDIKLVFLDVVMPKVDGVECLTWIKDDPEIAHLPVYMLSGLEDQTLTDVCIEKGAEGMFMKPLNIAIINQILLEQEEAENRKIKIGNDEEAFEVEDEPSGEEAASAPPPVVKAAPIQQMAANWTGHVVVSVGRQAPAFKLPDSDFIDFVYPSPRHPTPLVAIFIPTIFFTDMYDEDGFLVRMYEDYAEIQLSDGPGGNISFVVIASDMPWVLASAKKRFNLPFRLLSDPSHHVSERYVGTQNIGSMQAGDDEYASRHPQNSWVGPIMGVVLLNKERDVIQKWTAVDSEGVPDISIKPPSIVPWINGYREQHSGSSGGGKPSLKAVAGKVAESASSSKQKIKIGPGERKFADVAVKVSTRAKVEAKFSDAKAAAMSAIPPEEEEVKRRVSVLVVDDSSVSSRVATKKLEKLGYMVESAYNGQIGYDMVKKDPLKYTVVLVDICMPVCDGTELLKMMKSEDDLAHIPVVMLSGLEGADLVAGCLENGAAAVMKKPFDEKVFLDVLKAQGII